MPLNCRMTSPIRRSAASAGEPRVIDVTPSAHRTGQPGLGRHRRSEVAIQIDAQERAGDLALLDQLPGDDHDHVDRNREADPFVPARTAGDGRIDADDLAAHVDQRAAAVARIDGRVGLEEVLEEDLRVSQFEISSPLGADDAEGADWLSPKGLPTARTKSPICRSSLFPMRRRDEARRGDVHHRDVGSRVVPDLLGVDQAAVGQVDLDPLRRRLTDDVPVGQDVVVVLQQDDHARPGLFDPLESRFDVGLDVDDGRA